MCGAFGALRKIAQELKPNGPYDTLLAGAITFDQLNALGDPRNPA
jgi:hypothetical protein